MPTPKQIASGCRYFNGIHHEQCEVGVDYKQFLYQNYDKFPCHTKPDGTFTGACPLFEFHTVEEIEAQEKEMERLVAALMEKLNNDICPHCGTPIKHKEQVGRCVYARPCNCRLYQGKLKK